jgi:16S rRNA (adenine1518-N6/adenine1519-N6)-dimethyltransferase
MSKVTPKKHLGQHFLNDEGIAEQTANALINTHQCKHVLEIGPGMGMLSKYLLQNKNFITSVVEIDNESVQYLKKNYPNLTIIEDDFLKLDLEKITATEKMAVIGNFPYNISSQILFKVLENKNKISELVGMFQKEVAERVASKHGNKTYGILSVLLQAFYSIDYLFTVNENVFTPPPKVKSAVIRLTRNNIENLGCDEVVFKKVVKAGFNQRRKTLRNALRAQFGKGEWETRASKFLDKRAEQLSVAEFVELTNCI